MTSNQSLKSRLFFRDSLADAVLEEEAQARTRREAPMMRHVLMQRDGNARRQLTTTTHFAARPGPSRLPLVAVPMAYLNGSTVSQPPLGAAAPEGEDVLVLVATGGSDSIHVGSRNAVRDTWVCLCCVFWRWWWW